MSKLTALKKQIALLQAQAERIAKTEMSSAVAKVKDIMAEFNLTIEHLTHGVGGKRAAKKPKVKTASVAKYADPKTGKTWSGFGRAPGWIAGAKNRDVFLVGKSTAAESIGKVPTAAKKAPARVAKAVKAAKKTAKPAAKNAAAPVKKPRAETAPAPAAKKAAAKQGSTKKSAPKSASSKRTAAAPAEPTAAPAA